MTHAIIITGTDTDCGKTVFAAALAAALDGCYWKPIQCGLEGETDSQTVLRLGGLVPERILPEAYALATPASPRLTRDHHSRRFRFVAHRHQRQKWHWG